MLPLPLFKTQVRLLTSARSRHTCLVILVVTGALAGAVWSALRAQEQPGSTRDADAASGPIRILVLFDGRVVEGDIEERPGGYLVQQPNGAIVLPFELIRATATTLAEAYEKQRDNFVYPTANDRLGLAQWCYTNKLYAQANAELEAVLRLEPQRSDARELLKLVNAATSRAARRAEGQGPASGGGDLTSGRIRSETHAEFIRAIQPLLVNKCGNATCHGTASNNAFRLTNVRSGLRHQRLHSDQNLAAVLAQISAEFPQQSPLLLKPQDREMTVHRGIFFGASGDGQIQMLRDWIEVAAADLIDSGASAVAPEAPLDAARPARTAADVVPQAELPATPSVAAPDTAFPRPKPKIVNIPRPDSPRANELLRSVLDEEQPDPFDPEEFNRQVHGAPPRSGSPTPPRGSAK